MRRILPWILAAVICPLVAYENAVGQARRIIDGVPVASDEVKVAVVGEYVYVWPCDPWYAKRIRP